MIIAFPCDITPKIHKTDYKFVFFEKKNYLCRQKITKTQ